MYNRYIRNDQGEYTRIPEEEPQPAPPLEKPKENKENTSDFLRRLLGQSHFGSIDTGDLLLLGLLFFLYREGADEELLIALGLLLII